MDGSTDNFYKISSKTRTDGDGMESSQSVNVNENIDNSQNARKEINLNSQKGPTIDTICPSISQPQILINLTPKEIHYVSKKPKVLSKEPKFVPYEPYKAAIRPIVPKEKDSQTSKKKSTKNNMDLNVLVSQIALIDTNPIPFKSSKKTLKTSKDDQPNLSISDLSKKQWENEREEMKNEIFSLRNKVETLQDQIKQQAQVNKELKTMLVASMGEDLETTVQTLTEDKQQLASALINSAKHLSTHQEQTEWLAGQCEVWRSKFLASSLMVEELAGWKHSFTERTDDLQISLKQILEERNRIRDILIHTYRNLQSLHENWLTNLVSKELYSTSLNELGGFGIMEQTPVGSVNLASSKLKSSNILDLASVNLRYSENLCTGVEKIEDFTQILNELPVNTDAENLAEKLLATPLIVSGKNDHPSSALVHHAYTKTGMTPNIACCSHCNGRVQLL